MLLAKSGLELCLAVCILTLPLALFCSCFLQHVRLGVNTSMAAVQGVLDENLNKGDCPGNAGLFQAGTVVSEQLGGAVCPLRSLTLAPFHVVVIAWP